MRGRALLIKIAYTAMALTMFCYAFFRIYGLIIGPRIDIYYPQSGDKVDPVFTVTGRVKNSDEVFIRDRSIFLDELGNFKENIIANERYTEVEIKAKNRWGQVSSETLLVESLDYAEPHGQPLFISPKNLIEI